MFEFVILTVIIVLFIELRGIYNIRSDPQNHAYQPICTAIKEKCKNRSAHIVTSYPQLIAWKTHHPTIDGRRVGENIYGIINRFHPRYVVLDNLRTPAYSDYLRDCDSLWKNWQPIHHDREKEFVILELN
ncbi:MAG: hypothetical protein HQL49_07750 [Gammaproteobacteria bacterium]|nr:hypothetical protein [Gammaproteobacteria bacterium]